MADSGFADPVCRLPAVRSDSRRLQVDVKNQGNGFYPDLGDRRAGSPGRSFEHPWPGGFGLMLALVDQIQVLSDDGNTVLRLTKSKTV